jgi:YVTN family beta-propeller protein
VRIIASGRDPEQFDISADGKLLFVANENSSSRSVVDASKGVVTRTFPVGAEPEGVKVSPDGRFVYGMSESESTVSVIDLEAARVAKVYVELLADTYRFLASISNWICTSVAAIKPPLSSTLLQEIPQSRRLVTREAVTPIRS